MDEPSSGFPNLYKGALTTHDVKSLSSFSILYPVLAILTPCFAFAPTEFDLPDDSVTPVTAFLDTTADVRDPAPVSNDISAYKNQISLKNQNAPINRAIRNGLAVATTPSVENGTKILNGELPVANIPTLLYRIAHDTDNSFQWLMDENEVSRTRFAVFAQTTQWTFGDDPLFKRARFVIEILNRVMGARMNGADFDNAMKLAEEAAKAA